MSTTNTVGTTTTAPLLRTELPGPRAREVLARDEAVTSRSLPRAYPLVPRRGRGCVIEDVDGNLFLDFNAGIAVNSTGHAHPRVVEAVRRQSEELLHYSASDFYLPIYSEMCKALADTAPIDGPARVFLTNSGTEAVEGALKLARHATGRQYAISFYGSFHGRSYGAVSLTASKSKYHKGFGPLLPGILHAPYGSDATFEHLEDVLFRHVVSPDEVAAIFVEPVQGEGGYIVPPEGWLARLRELCDRHGILLVADEVQSGVGRTGKMWAIEHTGVRPDVLLSAKGLASGLPLGAFVARADLMETWPAGAHGSTYGGSPVPCAAGLATLEVIGSEGLLANATTVGERLTAGLREFQARWPEAIVDVRGVGLMLGVELATAELAEAVQQAAFERGLLVLECGESSIRVSPPLVITEAEADTGLRVLGEALAAVVG
ncbi:aminotransferase class III-fold pyridoxal phosphate-dependent enzyme [Actinosynnema pretiosum subsp. pretiosum]|uniref:(S)-3-amino-2-methylpropionate transaminase n=2 Tax=Actinosynnema TaxID=40566 RepID=C6W7X1_ACTMD|nr:aminotransferase class III-fold pyridoxal phosphate-dependent enzyme [Actinosynnema mirum]ACU36992.1 Acetylornithine transaminase [Actinosynnema mirum DSM 43827]AXX30475.1 Ornithine aminotransferase [Actinosynnema pretiosum subsp. pretiosum]QUF05382.1 aminotransferase class III-fold pyridoxal phosphate-dependent enzyme [Actinosynnema pretiosum subsp. pretiosum]